MIDETEDVLFLLECDKMVYERKMLAQYLRKRGVKLREFKWSELEAS